MEVVIKGIIWFALRSEVNSVSAELDYYKLFWLKFFNIVARIRVFISFAIIDEQNIAIKLTNWW